MEHDQLVAPAQARIMSTYLTCELATVTRSGMPIAWPVTGVWRPDDQAFVVSTSIGFPQKAFNVRRDPHVALLFSDPTGSGLDGEGQVLIQGVAECADEIETRFSRNADLWERVSRAQPSARALSAGWLARRLMDVYYMRLVITVTPTAVTARPPLPGAAPVPAPSPLAVPAVPGVPEPFAGELAGFTSAVLAGLDDAGHPTLDRVVPEPADGGLLLPGSAAQPGRASLLFHRHDELLAAQRSFAVVGELVESPRGSVLRPERVADGIQPAGLASTVRMARGLRKRAQAYLDARGLERPEVPWGELKDIYARVDAENAAR
ncbi:pyridoxamine 5'-phosphate oxidase family protein [Promicromonospora sp. NPDC050880]|uniref:pyridoxamine 5'-phosphate oxidase family protein n=1 Tax=Promicromonospora sp. NPDC050880 TaxID=3364406 RepID=UPI0037A29297